MPMSGIIGQVTGESNCFGEAVIEQRFHLSGEIIAAAVVENHPVSPRLKRPKRQLRTLPGQGVRPVYSPGLKPLESQFASSVNHQHKINFPVHPPMEQKGCIDYHILVCLGRRSDLLPQLFKQVWMNQGIQAVPGLDRSEGQ